MTMFKASALRALLLLALTPLLAHAQQYTDNFDRADDTSLGSPWVDVEGEFDLITNAAESQGVGSNTTRYNNTTPNDQFSCAVYVSDADGLAGVTVRSSGSAGAINAYYGYVNESGAGWFLQDVTGGR